MRDSKEWRWAHRPRIKEYVSQLTLGPCWEGIIGDGTLHHIGFNLCYIPLAAFGWLGFHLNESFPYHISSVRKRAGPSRFPFLTNDACQWPRLPHSAISELLLHYSRSHTQYAMGILIGETGLSQETISPSFFFCFSVGYHGGDGPLYPSLPRHNNSNPRQLILKTIIILLNYVSAWAYKTRALSGTKYEMSLPQGSVFRQKRGVFDESESPVVTLSIASPSSGFSIAGQEIWWKTIGLFTVPTGPEAGPVDGQFTRSFPLKWPSGDWG